MLPDTFQQLSEHLRHRRLRQAIGTAQLLISQYPALAPDAEQVMQVEQDLQLMTDALLRGYEDAQRNDFFAQLLKRMHTLKDDMQMRWYRHYDAAIAGYWARAKTIRGDADSIRRQLEQLVAQKAVQQLQTQMNTDGTAANTDGSETQHYQYLNILFLRMWLSRPWRKEQEEQFAQLLLSPTIEPVDACVMVSGLTLSLLLVADERKLRVLQQVYQSSSDETVRQRALAGCLLAAYHAADSDEHNAQAAKDSVSTLADNDTARQQMLEMQMQLFYCITTEEDNRTIQRDIMPTLLKNSPIVIRDGVLIERDDDDELDDILNPHAEEQRMEEMEEGMRKMMNMQQEGVDVFFEGFSKMKHLPFFHDMAAWFMPFSLQHPALQNVHRQSPHSIPIIQALLNRGPFCDSDKYSFALVLEKTIQNLPPNLMEALSTADAEMEEHFRVQRNDPAYIRRMYLQNLFRFFQLHRDRQLFHTPLSAEAVADHTLALLSLPDTLTAPLAAFLYRRRQNKALITLAEQQQIKLDADTRLLYALALQQEGFVVRSIDMLQLVLAEQPSSVRAMSALARALMHEKRYAEARPLYNLLLEQKPHSVAYALRLALCMVETDAEEEALKIVYEQSFRHADDADVQRMLGWTLLRCRQPEKAQQALQPLAQAASATPTDSLYLAYSLWAQGQRAAAVPLLQQYATRQAQRDGTTPRRQLEQALADDGLLMQRYGIDQVEQQLILDEAIRQSGDVDTADTTQ